MRRSSASRALDRRNAAADKEGARPAGSGGEGGVRGRRHNVNGSRRGQGTQRPVPPRPVPPRPFPPRPFPQRLLLVVEVRHARRVEGRRCRDVGRRPPPPRGGEGGEGHGERGEEARLLCGVRAASCGVRAASGAYCSSAPTHRRQALRVLRGTRPRVHAAQRITCSRRAPPGASPYLPISPHISRASRSVREVDIVARREDVLPTRDKEVSRKCLGGV
jgi:hypothetical protein